MRELCGLHKAFILMLAGMALLLTFSARAAGFDNQLVIDGQTLYLNGQGPRKKAFITVYDTALYLTEKGSDAQAIVNADHPMSIKLIVRSRFATAKRISEAFREALEKSTSGNTQSFQPQIEQFLDVFHSGVVKEDSFVFAYMPEKGLEVRKNGTVTSVIKGLDFKQALFGIWLSADPVQNRLKSQLLGK